MFDAKNSRLILVATVLALAGLTAACESAVEREMRLEREALKESGELEELEKQVETVNPDPYDPKTTGTKNIGRFKNN
ncbi:hypothetical protein [Pelagibius marinus]|uniref:hypothetical protein n=1 Tax=Pelagibius marinus TaxID=2762760 RepID=UPI001872FACF|nr:hypothetical protein [Pelagibius marinus]